MKNRPWFFCYSNCMPIVIFSSKDVLHARVFQLLRLRASAERRAEPVGSDHRAVRVYVLPASENDPKVPLRVYDSPNWMDVSSLCTAQRSSPNDSAFTSLRKREQKAKQDACSDYARATQALWHALAGRLVELLKRVNLLVKLGCGNQSALRQMSGLQLRRLAERMVAQQIDEQIILMIIDHLTEHWHYIFDSVLPCDVSLTDVKRLILRSPNTVTAPGPDGIQMRAWQTHVDKVAPIFLQAYTEWLDGQLPAGAAKS
eukprot:2987172-Amphidinium_carterae.1